MGRAQAAATRGEMLEGPGPSSSFLGKVSGRNNDSGAGDVAIVVCRNARPSKQQCEVERVVI